MIDFWKKDQEERSAGARRKRRERNDVVEGIRDDEDGKPREISGVPTFVILDNVSNTFFLLLFLFFVFVFFVVVVVGGSGVYVADRSGGQREVRWEGRGSSIAPAVVGA